MGTTDTVTVHGGDHLSRAGLIGYLARSGVRALEYHGRSADLGAVVAIVIIDRWDESARAEVQRLVSDGRPVALIAGQLDEPDVISALESGVLTIVWRHQATPERIARAALVTARGGSELPPELLGHLLSAVARGQRHLAGATASALDLTGREVDVLSLVADGLDTHRIAAKLAYSERTVKSILHGLMSRLQLATRAHAVAYAFREGYL